MSMDWRRKGNSSVGESDVDPHACALGSPGQVEIRYDCFMIVISFLASHIDTTVLVDGMYELIPESEGGDQEAQVNAAILTEDPD